MKFQIHMMQDEAGYYVIEVPALPGCLSQGKTEEEAIHNIREAIEGWLEVMNSRSDYSKGELIEVNI